MNTYKRIVLLLLFLVSTLLLPNAFAHPGRTDANGGHWDRKNGTYHFHTGEYAGRGGGGSSSSEYVPFTPPYEPPTDNPYRENNAVTKENTSKKLSVSQIILGIFLLPFVLGLFYSFFEVLFVELLYWSILEKHLPRYKINLLQEKINKFNQMQNEISELNIKISDLSLKCQIPDLYEIANDNLPKDKNSVSAWGKSFTLYKTTKGIKLHSKYNCCSATKPIHIYKCRNYRDFSKLLCKKCANNYVIPDMSWYDIYLKIEQAEANRQNIENDCNRLLKEIEVLHKKCNSIKTKTMIIFSKKNKIALRDANNKYNKLPSIQRRFYQ